MHWPALGCQLDLREEAVTTKDANYGGTYRLTYAVIPLSFSACGDVFSSAQELIKAQSELQANTEKDYRKAPDLTKIGIQAREIAGRLQHRLSIVMQRALAYRTLQYVGRQTIVEPWRRR